MKRTIQVYLGDDARRIGTLNFDAVGSRQHSAFAYEVSWLGTADRFAIDPGLPLVAGPQYPGKSRDGSVFHAAIADTEPDGWAKRGTITTPKSSMRSGYMVQTPRATSRSSGGAWRFPF